MWRVVNILEKCHVYSHYKCKIMESKQNNGETIRIHKFEHSFSNAGTLYFVQCECYIFNYNSKSFLFFVIYIVQRIFLFRKNSPPKEFNIDGAF